MKKFISNSTNALSIQVRLLALIRREAIAISGKRNPLNDLEESIQTAENKKSKNQTWLKKKALLTPRKGGNTETSM